MTDQEEKMKKLTKQSFGITKDGKEAFLYTLENSKGMKISMTDFGAALVSVQVPDYQGNLRDVVTGYETVSGYEEGNASFGAPVGRCANRIAGASFEINGQTYELEKNEREKNNLHSGNDFYNKRLWKAEEGDTKVTFVLHSPHMDQGFPGNLDMYVTYELTEENEVQIHYHAVPDKDTIINMTNHSYFNLNGHQSGEITEHLLWVDSDYFTRADEESIPTGEVIEVTGTPMDFRTFTRIGENIDADYEATILGCGYDHNWMLKNEGVLKKVAEVKGDQSKIVMDILTDLPGMQIYTANFLEAEKGKEGCVYERRTSVCFETQYVPDAIHHENFISPVCKADQAYDTTTIFRFRIEK